MNASDMKVQKEKFTFVSEEEKVHEDTRPSLTYWADAWRRLKKDLHRSMVKRKKGRLMGQWLE